MKKSAEEIQIKPIDTLRSVFQERLISRRHRVGITQQELANRSGVSLRAISNYEAGDLPTLDSLYKLANTLGVRAPWFLGENIEEGSVLDDRAKFFSHLNSETLFKNLAEVGPKMLKLDEEERKILLVDFRAILDELEKRERAKERRDRGSVEEVASRAAQKAVEGVRRPGVAFGRNRPRMRRKIGLNM